MTKKSPFVFMDPAKPVAVWWPCKISVPVDSKDGDGGLREEQDLNVRFVVLPDDEVTGLLVSGGQKALLERIVVAWDAVDENGVAVPFERFAEISSVAYISDGILAGYRDFAGRAPTKN